MTPLKERFPAALPVPESCMEDFKKRVAYLEATLDQLIADTERESVPPAALAVSENL